MGLCILVFLMLSRFGAFCLAETNVVFRIPLDIGFPWVFENGEQATRGKLILRTLSEDRTNSFIEESVVYDNGQLNPLWRPSESSTYLDKAMSGGFVFTNSTRWQDGFRVELTLISSLPLRILYKGNRRAFLCRGTHKALGSVRTNMAGTVIAWDSKWKVIVVDTTPYILSDDPRGQDILKELQKTTDLASEIRRYRLNAEGIQYCLNVMFHRGVANDVDSRESASEFVLLCERLGYGGTNVVNIIDNRKGVVDVMLPSNKLTFLEGLTDATDKCVVTRLVDADDF